MERSRVGGKRAGPTASTRGVYKLCQCFCFVCVCVSVCLCVCLSLFCLCLFFSLSSSTRLLAVPLSLFRIYRQSHRWPSALKRSTPNPISQGVCVCVSVCVCVCVLAILFGIDAALTSNAQPPPQRRFLSFVGCAPPAISTPCLSASRQRHRSAVACASTTSCGPSLAQTRQSSRLHSLPGNALPLCVCVCVCVCAHLYIIIVALVASNHIPRFVIVQWPDFSSPSPQVRRFTLPLF